MVSNVSFNGNYNVSQYSKDLENAAKYALGTTIVKSDVGPFEGMGLMVGVTTLTETPKIIKWAKDAKGNGGFNKAIANEKAIFSADLAAKKAIFSQGNWKNIDTYKGIWNNYSASVVQKSIPSSEKLAQLNEETVKLYKRAGNLAKKAMKNPAQSAQILDKADEALALANKAAHGVIKPTTKFGKFTQFLGKITGFSKLSGGLKELAVKNPKIAKVLKFGKGNGAFLAISGTIELLTNIVPTFVQLGTAKGIKQIAKSTVKVGASVGGWAAGAAVGAAIGSVIPGAGTLIGGLVGALCGFVGGCVGSWAATKVAETVVGKDELVLAKEAEAKKLAADAAKNPQVAQEILTAASQRYSQEGGESEDAKVAFSSLTNLSNVSSQTQVNTQNPYSYNNVSSQSSNYSSNPFSSKNLMDIDLTAWNGSYSG